MSESIVDQPNQDYVCQPMEMCVRMTLDGSHSLMTVQVELGSCEHWEGMESVSSVEWMLQLVESPAFASRWIALMDCLHTSTPKVILKPSATRDSTRGPARTDAVHQLLKAAVVVRAKPPPIITLVLRQLEAKDLVRASMVCHYWYEGAKHDSAWTLLYEQQKPMLDRVRQQVLASGMVTQKELVLQQAQAVSATAVSLRKVSRDDYSMSIEVYADGNDDGSHQLTVRSTRKLIYHAVCELASSGTELVAHKPDKPTMLTAETSQSLSQLSVQIVLSVIRKRDTKRLVLCEGEVDDFDVSVDGLDGSTTTREFYHHSSIVRNRLHVKDNRFTGVFLFGATVVSQSSEEWDDKAASKLESISVDVDEDMDGENFATSVEGLLNVIECPCYDTRWR